MFLKNDDQLSLLYIMYLLGGLVRNRNVGVWSHFWSWIDRRRFVKSIKQVEVEVLLFLCLIGKSRRNLVVYSIL